MKSLSKIGIKLAAIFGVLVLNVGCAATTRIHFVAAPGTVMTVDGKPHHLPETIELSRPSGSSGSTRHEVSLVATVHSRELRTNGYLDLFGYTESEVDKTVVNTCVLDEDQLTRIFEGTAVIFRGQSASRQPLFDLTLGKR